MTQRVLESRRQRRERATERVEVASLAAAPVTAAARSPVEGVDDRVLLPRPAQTRRRRRSGPVLRRFHQAGGDEATLFVMTWQTGDVLNVDAVVAELAGHDLAPEIGTAFRAWLEQFQRLLEAAEETPPTGEEPPASQEPPANEEPAA